MRQGDWQILNNEINLQAYEAGDKRNWCFRRTFEDEDEVQRFLKDEHLELIEEGVRGTWPVRNYRKIKGLEVEVEEVVQLSLF